MVALPGAGGWRAAGRGESARADGRRPPLSRPRPAPPRARRSDGALAVPVAVARARVPVAVAVARAPPLATLSLVPLPLSLLFDLVLLHVVDVELQSVAVSRAPALSFALAGAPAVEVSHAVARPGRPAARPARRPPPHLGPDPQRARGARARALRRVHGRLRRVNGGEEREQLLG